MLAGLPEKFGPMIMAIEHSGININADAIKTKLLDMSTDFEGKSESAFVVKNFHRRNVGNTGGGRINKTQTQNDAGVSESSDNPLLRAPPYLLSINPHSIIYPIPTQEVCTVTALREHWDEANTRVLQRKAQLDAMLGDSQRYEARRRDADAWLARMEARLAAMGAPGHTADVLDMQLREQKSFHAEVHQYKHQIELFGQLTQRLIAMYRNDDTTRIKRATEAINHRYNELNNNIVARGKALQSAVSSLQNFDRSLEKFVAWLSEAESLVDTAERDPQLLKAGAPKKNPNAGGRDVGLMAKVFGLTSLPPAATRDAFVMRESSRPTDIPLNDAIFELPPFYMHPVSGCSRRGAPASKLRAHLPN
ncbi:Dystrophin, isoform B [Eumeta japonica]|uniref:Dystrophin, isoform B n=1 Tax=Eumeta variegata TaxID=151549 RepID=A0A4C1XLC7_EUMVA|nr:Dystrophin, isoform B [Eumeta japonica]